MGRRRRRRRSDGLAGVALVDKPAGPTSLAVVKRVQRALGAYKAGHTGTLDPMATGVLPVCLGQATRIAGLLLADDKTYSGSAVLGLETDTLDITGTVVSEGDPSAVAGADLSRALARHRGTIEQVPPAFSALRKDGVRAHQAAREGAPLQLAPRTVVVRQFEMLGADLSADGDGRPYFEFRVACGKGTYVRALVRDIGRALGCGATLSELRRLAVGAFDVSECVRLDQIETAPQRAVVLTIDQALARMYRAVQVDADQALRLRQGQGISLEGGEGLVRIRHGDALVGLGEQRDGRLLPRRVFGVEGIEGSSA